MTFLEALIIYLSAGAPFGVLVFFSRRAESDATSLIYALMATVAWPVFGTYRLYRGLFRPHPRPFAFDSGRTPLEVLRRVSKEVPVEAAEIFEVAGHSNPWIATNCYARARKKVIESHIDRLSKTSITNEKSLVSLNSETIVSPQVVTTART